MRVVVEYITPERAKEMLKHNTNNYRKLSNKTVNLYARDMLHGEWKENGEPIIFAENGELRDGQHRLTAIVRSGKSFYIPVVYDVEDDIQLYDVGARRTSLQISAAEGLTGYLTHASTTATAKVILAGGNFREARNISVGMAVKFIQKYGELFQRAGEIVRAGHSSQLGRRRGCIAAVVYLLAAGSDSDELREFFTVVNSGYGIAGRECSAAVCVRNWLQTVQGRGQDAAADEYLFTMTVNAYRDYHNGKARKQKYRLDYGALKGFEKLCEELANA